ncbi:MAG TPA: protein kinase [Streptosporangiaceae bacterium]
MVGELQAGDPQSVGPYRLLGRLGAGGMGQVFLGRSAGGRLVAVKVIRPELAGEPGFRTRFAREVAAARNVSGLFTALVVDADVDGTMPWLATAYVAGPSLAEAVEEHGPLPVESVLTLAAGLAEGLGVIHAAGVVHRDLKPSNVLLADDGPRVIDFGISRAAEASVLTQSGTVLGSPGFMSPEQAEGGEVGPPSDVFSLGAILTFAATCEGPFGTGSTPALIYRVVHHQPDVSHLPDQLRNLVERCLAKDPAQRPTTSDLLAELGNGQLAADWLPAPMAEVLARYAAEAAADGSSVPVESSEGPSTVTSAARRRSPTAPAVLAQPAEPGKQPERKKRRYLIWVPVIAGLMAASAAAAIFLPEALRNAAAPHSTPTIGQGAALRPSHSPRPTVSGPAPQSTATKKVSSTPTGSSTGTGTTGNGSTGTGTTGTGTNGNGSTGNGSTGNGSSGTAQPPQITNVQTYTQGVYVYFDISYADSDNDAEGFGFVGVNGSGWGEEQHPFSSPSYGTAGPGWIEYPFNENCGSSPEVQSYVKAWIYDAEGTSSQPVVIHLVCSD